MRGATRLPADAVEESAAQAPAGVPESAAALGAPGPEAAAASGGAGPAGLEAAAQRDPEDEPWATTFGAAGVAPYPSAIAVRGQEVFIGGDFTLEMAGMPENTYVRVAHWDGSPGSAGDRVQAVVLAHESGLVTPGRPPAGNWH